MVLRENNIQEWMDGFTYIHNSSRNREKKYYATQKTFQPTLTYAKLVFKMILRRSQSGLGSLQFLPGWELDKEVSGGMTPVHAKSLKLAWPRL
jgi:hypothetical protein